MADKKASKAAKKFVSLLASRFKEDQQDIDKEELRSYLDEAVSNLPISKLKTALRREFDVHFKHFSSILNVFPKATKQHKDIPASQKTLRLNIYGREGLERAFETLKESLSSDEANNICKGLQACFPYLTSTKRIFATLREAKRSDDLSSVQKCTEMTIGCHTRKSILECLSFILEEFSSKCEACINAAESDSKTKRVRDLQNTLHKNIVLMNHRWMASNDEISADDDVTSEESYEDLMAAMLSLYTDLQLVSSSITEESSVENLATLVFAVLGHSPEHCMDVFLQVTQLDCNSVTALIPLLRCILERNQGMLKITQYIKFISLARIGLQLCSSSSSTKTKISIRKVAEKQSAPARFVSIVSKHDRSLAERLQLSKKMNADQVTSRLLGEQREEDMEALLDLASESREESGPNTAEDHGPTDETQGDQTTDQPLFFFDSAGGKADEEESQKVEFEEHEVEDAILHRQLKTIIGQLEEHSDPEDDDIVDDLFIIDKNPSTKSNQNNENYEKESDSEDDSTRPESPEEQILLDSGGTRGIEDDEEGEPEECNDENGDDQRSLDSVSSPLKRKQGIEDDEEGEPEECNDENGDDQRPLDSAASPLKRKQGIEDDEEGEPEECNDENGDDQRPLDSAASPLKRKQGIEDDEEGEPEECNDENGDDQRPLDSAASPLKRKQGIEDDEEGEPEECNDENGDDQRPLDSAASPLKRKQGIEDDEEGEPEECNDDNGDDQRPLDSAASPSKRKQGIEDDEEGEPEECNDENGDDQRPLDSAASPFKKKRGMTVDDKEGESGECKAESLSRKKTKKRKNIEVKGKRKSMTEATPVKMATRSSSRRVEKSCSSKK